MCKQISSHLKIKLPTDYLLTNHMNIFLNMCKQMTEVKLLQLNINNYYNLTVCKQIIYSK